MDSRTDFLWDEDGGREKLGCPAPAPSDFGPRIANQMGGLWIGQSVWSAIGLHGPFSSLVVHEYAVTLSVLGKKYVLGRGCITEIRRMGLFGKGFRIRHESADIPTYLVFWSYSSRRLRQAFLDSGYPIE